MRFRAQLIFSIIRLVKTQYRKNSLNKECREWYITHVGQMYAEHRQGWWRSDSILVYSSVHDRHMTFQRLFLSEWWVKVMFFNAMHAKKKCRIMQNILRLTWIFFIQGDGLLTLSKKRRTPHTIWAWRTLYLHFSHIFFLLLREDFIMVDFLFF